MEIDWGREEKRLRGSWKDSFVKRIRQRHIEWLKEILNDEEMNILVEV